MWRTDWHRLPCGCEYTHGRWFPCVDHMLDRIPDEREKSMMKSVPTCPHCGAPVKDDHGPQFDPTALDLLDITAPEVEVEVQVRNDKKVIWVHVDGKTVLRICRIPKLTINQE